VLRALKAAGGEMIGGAISYFLRLADQSGDITVI
jgi:hypothetical protein